MQQRFFTFYFVACVALAVNLCEGSEFPLLPRSQTPSTVPEPYVQITSVRVEPTIIHSRQNPTEATVVVEIRLQGEPPPNPKIRLEVGTYSADPPNNTVQYQEATRIVSIEKGLTAASVRVDADPDTVKGKIKVIANIMGASKGLYIEPPDTPEKSIAELTTVAP